MSKVEEYAAFLDSIHLFQGISEEHLFDIAERLDVVKFEAGEEIFAEGERANSFYLIFSGKVEVISKDKGQKKITYRHKDFLGEDAILPSEFRQILVKAKGNVVLLELSSTVFGEIPDAVDFLKGQLKSALNCRSISTKTHFDWIESDEAVYFIVRKHPILFWKASAFSIILGLFGISFSFWGMWVGSYFALAVGILSFLISLVLVIWFWVDWQNDYYAITNQRVIWFEKVVGLHESRQDVFLHEILSVGMQDDLLSGILGYATISVRTMVGTLSLKHTPLPEEAKSIIEDLWHHAKEEASQKKEDELHQAIADKLKSVQPVTPIKKKAPPPPSLSISEEISSPRPKKTFFKRKPAPKKDRHFFDLQYKSGAEIIYRKHWVILLIHAGIPFLVSLFFFLFFIYELYLIILVKSDFALSISLTAFLAIAGFISLAWVYYQYLDWSNDIFKVSPTQISDIDRKPFGDEKSRSAPLGNIESTEYKRKGMLSIFFNYGTVYIHIGAEHFEFEDVYDPASVQRDINRRHMGLQEKKKAAEAKKKRDEMLPWLIAYHQGADKFDEMMKKIKEAEERKKKAEEEIEAEG